MPPPAKATTTIDGDLAYGEQITVTTQTSGDDRYAYTWTKVSCFQGEELVSAQFSPVRPNEGTYEDIFTLSSPAWTGGAARGQIQVFVESLDLKRTKSDVTDEFEVAA